MPKSAMFKMIKKLKKAEKNNIFLLRLHRFWVAAGVKLLGEVKYTAVKYRVRTGKRLDLEAPKGFTEKIQWLKLFFYQPYYQQSCDKYLIHSFLKERIGEDLCPELLFATNRISEFSLGKIKQFPCIIKISNGSGQNLIVHRKDEYTDAELKKRIKCMIYDANTHARYGCEKQYLKKDPYIIVEKLLLDANNKIPDDYKFFFMNGMLKFVYCSVDRLGKNVRQLYDPEWNRYNALLLQNATEDKLQKAMAVPALPKPAKFDEMLEIGTKVSRFFPLVRVDYYEVDGHVYVGELTLHHGGGFDKFYPGSYDEFFGKELELPEKNV